MTPQIFGLIQCLTLGCTIVSHNTTCTTDNQAPTIGKGMSRPHTMESHEPEEKSSLKLTHAHFQATLYMIFTITWYLCHYGKNLDDTSYK